MKRSILSIVAATAALSTLASTSFAAGVDAYPTEITQRPLTLPSGVLQLNGNATIDLSKGGSTAIEVSPNAAYGVSDDLEVSLTHQGHGSLFFGPSGSKVYNGFGADVTYRALKSPLGIAPHAGLDVGPFDPTFRLGVNVGARLWINFSDKLALSADPRMGFGLAHREGGVADYLAIPVALLIQTNDRFGLRIESGVSGGLKTYGDTYAVPAGVAGVYALSHGVDVGARFTFTGIVNGYHAGALDGRTLGVFANLRL